MHHLSSPPPGPFGRLLAFIAGLALLATGFLFSLVLVVILAVAGLGAWAYFWWRGRHPGRAMSGSRPGGTVIDGEAVVVNKSSPRLIEDPDNRDRG